VDNVEQKLIGESLREIGVLVLVFIPLDVFFDPNALRQATYPMWMHGLPLKDWLMLFFGVIGFFLIYCGIKLEGKCIRREKRDERDAISDLSV